MRVYRTMDRGTDMMMAGFGQSPTVSPAAKFALDNSVEWPAGMDFKSIVGMLAVRADGSQIARLGWTVENTPNLVFRANETSPWVAALVFEGNEWGKVIFIDSTERPSWRLVRTPYNDQLYITMTLPSRFESSITIGSFAEHIQSAYAQADRSLKAAHDKDLGTAKAALNEMNGGAKGHRDNAIQEARVLMTLGTLDLDDARIVQSIVDQLTKDVAMTEVAVGENKGIDTTHAILEANAQVLGDRFDQLAESGVVRGLAYYLILGAYQETQTVLLPHMPAILQPLTTQKIQATTVARQGISKTLADVGINAQGAVAEMQGLGMLSGVSDVGQLWTALKGFLKRTVGGAWRGKSVASTGKELIIYEEKAAAKGAASGLFFMGATKKTVGGFLSATLHTAWAGIVFGFAGEIYRTFGTKTPQSTLVDEAIRSIRAQQEAMAILTKEDQEKLKVQEKATGNGLKSDYLVQDGLNKVNPDPALESRLKKTREALAKLGVDTSGDDAPTVMPWVLGGLAAAGVGYLAYKRYQDK